MLNIPLNCSSRSQQLLSQLVPDLVHPVRLARNTGVQIDSNHRDAAHQILTDYHRELQQTLDTSDTEHNYDFILLLVLACIVSLLLETLFF